MSDAELRELRRAARTGDLAASRALARALDRVGDRRGKFLELCRLARAGEVDAIAAIAPGSRRIPGLRGAARVVGEIAGEALAGEEATFAVVDENSMLTISRLEDGVAAWKFRRSGAVSVLGPDLLVAGPRLELWSGERGELLAACELPVDWYRRYRLAGDRMAIVGGRGRGTIDVFDLGERFGERLWKRDPEGEFVPIELGTLATARSLIVASITRTATRVLECRDIETGELSWTISSVVLLEADERSVLVADQGLERAALHLIDAVTGQRVWTSERRFELTRTPVLLGANEVLVREEELVVLERATGAVRWARGHTVMDGIALAADTAYVLVEPDDQSVVLGHDLISGEEVLSVELPRPGFATPCPLRGALALNGEGTFTRIVS